MSSRKNQKLRLSIVIPAYNEAKQLKACLASITAQTILPDEVIVVDNNSTDDTVAVAKSFDFVKVITAKSQGVVHARNAGFDAASGDIIGRLDADISLPDNWCEHILEFYGNEDNRTKAWTGSGWFYNVRLPHLVSMVYSILAFGLNRLLIGQYTLWGSNMAILKSQWQKVVAEACKDTNIHEDLDLAIHLKKHGYKVHYDTSIKTHAELRRVHANRSELWEYLQWWPRTLRRHNMKSWIVCWILTVIPLYIGALVLIAADKLARLFGRPNL